MLDYDAAREIAMSLPGAFEQETYGGQPSWRIKPRMFAWIRLDPEALVVWVYSEQEKQSLIKLEPDKYFTTPHYDGHAIVLIRLDAVNHQEATELITESWKLRAPRKLVHAWSNLQE